MLIVFPITVSTNVGSKPVLPTGSVDGYLTFDQTNEYLRNAHSLYLPETSSPPFSIGKSRSGRTINAVCLGKCDDTNAPGVLFTGLHHAREPISLMTLVYTLHHISLMSYYNDPETQALLSSRQLWFIPLVNPDGYVDNLEKSAANRNRRKNTLPGCSNVKRNGVDLNRNYETCWAGDTLCEQDQFGQDCGNNPNPCAEDYRGSAMFSEPETKAIRDFVGQHPNIKAALNYHSYGENLFWPYSCVKKKNSETEAQANLFKSIANELTLLNSYKASNVYDALHYNAAGDATDWMFDKHGIIAFTPEVGPNDQEAKANGRSRNYDLQDAYGFWPPIDRIPVHSNKSVSANIHLAWLSGPCYKVSAVQMKVVKGSDPSGQGLTTQITISLKIKNIGLKASGEKAFLQVFEEGILRLPSQTFKDRVKIGGRNVILAEVMYKVRSENHMKTTLIISDPENSECSAFLINHKSSSISDTKHLLLESDLCNYHHESKILPSGDNKNSSNAKTIIPSDSDSKPQSKTINDAGFNYSLLPYISGGAAVVCFVCFIFFKCKNVGEDKYSRISEDQIELGELSDVSTEPAFRDYEEDG